jgi:nitrous oxidase accessory protein NosD
VKLAPGVWRVADANDDGVLQITRDGTVLDLRGAALVGAADDVPPDRFAGVGILVRGARDVTIRGGVVRGYRVGVRALDAPGLVLRDVDASGNFHQHLGSTPAREDPGDWLWPHENDHGEWARRYGAGFALTGCAGAHVSHCRVRHGQNGLLLTRCMGARVEANDFSFDSGWGIALYRSTRCIVARNLCDFCVRGMSPGVYHRGQDSAALLVFEQSSDNVFVGNSATHSGDGFFLYAGHETTRRTGRGGCNRNLVFDNDFSFAVANGIEATFSLDNVFVRNDCSGCDHGVWAGYSARTLIAGNILHDCLSAGISIEHGQHNRLLCNLVRGGRAGVHLWWDADPDLVGGVYGRARDTSSSDNLLLGNDVRGAEVALQLVGDTGTAARWNDLGARRALLELGAGTKLGPFEHNLLRGPRRGSRAAPAAAVGPGAAGLALAPDNRRRGRIEAGEASGLEALPEALTLVRPPPRLPEVPTPPGPRVVRRPADAPRGRDQIRVGPWGPLDPALPAAFPTEIRAWGPRATVEVVGRGSWRVRRCQGAVLARPAEGTLPARLTLEPAPADPAAPQPSLRPFDLALDVAGRSVHVTGSLLVTDWRVTWFPWTRDPRADEVSWQRAAAAAARVPGGTHTLPAIDFHWFAKGPAGVAPDHFGTLATTTLHLPAGRYRLHTVSDDGVRLVLDGRRVIDRWTKHGPTEDVAEVDLPEGAHALRLEHFEIDGWARLGFGIERLP